MEERGKIRPNSLIFMPDGTPLWMNNRMAAEYNKRTDDACPCCGWTPLGKFYNREDYTCGCDTTKLHDWECGKCTNNFGDSEHCKCAIYLSTSDNTYRYIKDNRQIP